MRFKNDKGIHYESDEYLKSCGNYYYVNENALSNKPISRKDDIISLLYMILCWCLGKAPWYNVEGNSNQDYKVKMLQFKKRMNFKNLYGDKYHEILEIYKDVMSLGFKDGPKYEKYIEILSKYLKQKNTEKKQEKYFYRGKN